MSRCLFFSVYYILEIFFFTFGHYISNKIEKKMQRDKCLAIYNSSIFSNLIILLDN